MHTDDPTESTDKLANGTPLLLFDTEPFIDPNATLQQRIDAAPPIELNDQQRQTLSGDDEARGNLYHNPEDKGEDEDHSSLPGKWRETY